MMILHSRKLIFVHIAKNAGDWVTTVLRHHATSGDFELSTPYCRFTGQKTRTDLANGVRRFRRLMGFPQLVKHSSAREIRAVMPEAWETYTTIAVVRDAVDRAQSMIRYARTVPGLPLDPDLRRTFQALRATDDVSAFVLDGSFEAAMELRLFKPQTAYVTDETGRYMVDRLIHLDTLVDELSDIIPVPEQYRSKTINASRKDHGGATLNNAALAHLKTLYQIDEPLVAEVKQAKAA